MTIAATERWATCPFVDGPGFVSWLEEEGHLHAANLRGPRRIHYWRHGVAADAGTVDRILTPIGVGLWEAPDHLWIERPNNKERTDGHT